MEKPDFENRIKLLMQDVSAACGRHKVLMKPVVFFKKHKRVPLLSRLALWIIDKQGGVLETQFADLAQVNLDNVRENLKKQGYEVNLNP